MVEQQETVKSLGQYLQEDLVPALTQVVRNVTEHLAPIWQQVYDSMYEHYRSAGIPYGDTHVGFMRWLEDMKKIRQLQDEIDEILQLHQHLIDMRNFGETIRAKRAQQ